ncbi:ribosome biogenesis GTPase Der [Bythopirellula goksoeyrii]|uniref:GTPase Der n=1 Tax=Bythopirellula goksoeyrii TaxID=1400387 RepID=A0A5B9QC03_9BACT|nr:ribosome biogenesis GTPase Der [Bythopirellula goksoeyrii]QEG34446.1 GTPase Der [Bythopirellula goksoeyrii]
MGVPRVVIVGRPNVGKSSLLNWLAGLRIAIVEDQPGVTRDRVDYLMEYEGRFFELVDTGGIGIEDVDRLTQHIEDQIQLAIDSAAVILLVVDAREGLVPLDEEVGRRLRNLDVPVLCVANKADDPKFDEQAAEFYRLGRGNFVPVSSKQNRNRSVLLNSILERLPPEELDGSSDPEGEPEMKVAIVGRRNVGKSTLVNTLAKTQRMIVSEIPGTTRDSVDVRFELDGKSFVAIDTPGIRRPQSRGASIDFYGTHRAQRSIRRADVVFLFLDATQRISKVDKQLCDYISQQYKPCILVVNKWDMVVKTMSTDKWVRYLHDTFRTMRYAPIAFITGQTGKNVKALLNHGQMLFKQSLTRIPTGQLNRLLREAIGRVPPPIHQNRRPKIYYGTQVGSQPPTLVLFCSDPKGIDRTYQRYLLGAVRSQLHFEEVPIKLYLRKRQQSDQRDEIKIVDSTPEPIETDPVVSGTNGGVVIEDSTTESKEIETT